MTRGVTIASTPPDPSDPSSPLFTLTAIVKPHDFPARGRTRDGGSGGVLWKYRDPDDTGNSITTGGPSTANFRREIVGSGRLSLGIKWSGGGCHATKIHLPTPSLLRKGAPLSAPGITLKSKIPSGSSPDGYFLTVRLRPSRRSIRDLLQRGVP
jgi:hypothetical protein